MLIDSSCHMLIYMLDFSNFFLYVSQNLSSLKVIAFSYLFIFLNNGVVGITA